MAKTTTSNQNPLLYGIVGALIGGTIVWVTATSAVNNSNTGMMQMMGMHNTSSNNMMRNAENIDAHFIEQMIPHHEDAITMSELAQTKAQRPEIKELAVSIIDSQGKEISQMKEWYKEWFGRELPTDTEVMQHHGMGSGTGMHMGMRGTNEDITNLENAEDFDVAFIEHMIPHHQMAVMMATMLKNGTDRPEMKQLADDIITAQTTEIEKMRTWLTDWK